MELEIEDVRRRLRRLVERRLAASLNPAEQGEFDRLTRREADLLNRD